MLDLASSSSHRWARIGMIQYTLTHNYKQAPLLTVGGASANVSERFHFKVNRLMCKSE